MKNTLKIHDSAIGRFERSLQEEQERLVQDFLQTLQTRMAELNMSQSDMAYTLGKTRAYVSKLFSKGQNLTIKTMVELSHSLDMKLAISARRLWVDLHNAPEPIQLRNGWTPTRRVTCFPTPVLPHQRTFLQGSTWKDNPATEPEPLVHALAR